MISIEDCIAMCGLTREEVDAIAEHEHVPEAAATALASYILNRADGAERIREMIVDDIKGALDAGETRHAAELFSALQHFVTSHPTAPPRRR